MRARRRCWRWRLFESRFLTAFLFGLRTAAGAMLALLAAFSLQLDQPGWAATSAVIVAQPVLGATLRKGALRLLGTLVGACAAVLLLAMFPQDRWGFLIGLAVWGGLCSAAATLLGELVAYAPLLAGYTTAIIAMGAVSDPPNVFLLAVARGACIAIGILSTSIVFSLTARGRQRSRLMVSIEGAAREALDGLRGALHGPAPDLEAGQVARRALVARVATFDAVIDQAVGENIDLHARVGVLRRAVAGLLVILSSWRGIEQHRRRTSNTDEAAAAAEARLNAALEEASLGGLPEAGDTIERAAAASASERLLLDRVAHGLRGLAAVRSGLALLRDPLHAAPAAGLPPIRVGNAVSASMAGLRSAATVLLAGGVWIATGWDSGTTFVIFAMVIVVLFSNREDAAFGTAASMATSCVIALALGFVIKFVAMPWAQGMGFDGFLTFCMVVGGPLAVLGTVAPLLTPGRPVSALAFMSLANLMPLLSPTNEIAYDMAAFINGGLAILGGATFGALAYRVWPPLAPAIRVWLAVRAARRDLRLLAAGRWRPAEDEWEARQYARLVGLPPGTDMLDLARFLAALSVGRELLRRHLRSGDDEQRERASAAEIAEAVASHPDFFRGLGVEAAGR